MRWLIAAIVELVRWLSGRHVRGRAPLGRRRGLPAAAEQRDDMLDGVRTHGGHRVREVYVLGPRASRDEIGLDDDRIQFMDENAVQWDVRFREIRSCDCGALVGFGTSLLGACQRCHRTLCTRDGCAHRCEYCGAVVCSRHRVSFGNRTFCSMHAWYGAWLRFWGCV